MSGLVPVGVDARTPAYQILADALRAQITSGQLSPGDRLPTEPQLCRSSGVSRSTVREALRLLASQHLIETIRGVSGGSFVVHPSPAQLSETLTTGVHLLQASSTVCLETLLEARAAVEVAAAGLAAQHRSDEDLAALAAALFDPVAADLDAKLAAQAAFHMAVAAASGNLLLQLYASPLYTVANGRELAARLGPELWTAVDADHRAILDAIEQRSPDRARALAASHVERLRRAYAAVVPAPHQATSPEPWSGPAPAPSPSPEPRDISEVSAGAGA